MDYITEMKVALAVLEGIKAGKVEHQHAVGYHGGENRLGFKYIELLAPEPKDVLPADVLQAATPSGGRLFKDVMMRAVDKVTNGRSAMFMQEVATQIAEANPDAAVSFNVGPEHVASMLPHLTPQSNVLMEVTEPAKGETRAHISWNHRMVMDDATYDEVMGDIKGEPALIKVELIELNRILESKGPMAAAEFLAMAHQKGRYGSVIERDSVFQKDKPPITRDGILGAIMEHPRAMEILGASVFEPNSQKLTFVQSFKESTSGKSNEVGLPTPEARAVVDEKSRAVGGIGRFFTHFKERFETRRRTTPQPESATRWGALTGESDKVVVIFSRDAENAAIEEMQR